MNKSRQQIYQVLGTHDLINCARTNADMIREYALLLEIIQDLATASILPFDAVAIAVDQRLRSLCHLLLTFTNGSTSTEAIALLDKYDNL